MKQVKKIVIIALCVFMACVILHETYLFCVKKTAGYHVSQAPSDDDVNENVSESYDFKRMLRLIEQTEELKKTFHVRYTGFPSRKNKPIDVKQAKELLADLYREKVRMKHYVWSAKVYYKGNVPLKKRQTLLYYQNVIDKCAHDVEQILRRV